MQVSFEGFSPLAEFFADLRQAVNARKNETKYIQLRDTDF